MKRTIKFIPIKHGDSVEIKDLGIFGVSGSAKFLGFKPGRSVKREGWVVVADTGAGQFKKNKKKKAKLSDQ